MKPIHAFTYAMVALSLVLSALSVYWSLEAQSLAEQQVTP